MICGPCRKQNHILCPEIRRQSDQELNETELAGSVLCDCQHYEPGEVVIEGEGICAG